MAAQPGNTYAAGNKGGGRPSKYKVEYVDQAYKYCLLWATDAQLGEFFEVSEVTINNWKEEYEEFSLALKRGKAMADAQVAASLYKLATGYERDEVKIFQHQGEPVLVPHKAYYAPNTTAVMTWLKNRQPGRWRDKQDIDLTSKGKSVATKKADYSRLTFDEKVTLLALHRKSTSENDPTQKWDLSKLSFEELTWLSELKAKDEEEHE